MKPTIFPYNDLRAATRDFHEDMKLGQGGYGAVYKVQYKDHYFYSFITPMVHPRTCMLHNLLIHSYMPSAKLGDHLHLIYMRAGCVAKWKRGGGEAAVRQNCTRYG